MFLIIIIVVLIYMLIPDYGSENYKGDCIRKCMSRNRNSRSKCTNECKTESGVIKWT